MNAEKPRIIRRVTKTFRNGDPREARDRKSMYTMRAVKARDSHVCGSEVCVDRLILSGQWYASLSHPGDSGGVLIRRGLRVPPPDRKYHPNCVPEAAKPLVRFLRFDSR